MNPAIAHRRPGPKPTVHSVRPMTAADLDALRQPIQRPTITRLRDSHHRIAWLLAAGWPDVRISEALGISTVRIQQLKRDPAFQDLWASKRAHVDASHAAQIDLTLDTMSATVAKAERLILDQLEDAEATGSALPLRDLARITADRYDRLGYAKRSVNVNVNVDFAAKLEAAISRSRSTKP